MASPRPLRVVHLITDLDVGGAEVMLSRLVGAFSPSRIENVVVSLTSGGEVARKIAAAGTRVIELNMRRGRLNVGGLYRAMRLLQSTKPDIVQTWLYHADMVGLLAGKLARVPAIVWNIRCSELNDADLSPGFRRMLRLLTRCSPLPAAVICNSLAGRRAHQQIGYRARRWEIIPNGLNANDFQPSEPARARFREILGIREDVVLVGLIARLHPMKGHDTFLRAAAIAGRAAAAQFVLVGRGVPESRALQNLIADAGLSGRVHLLPERTDIAQIIAALDLVVCASTSEGFPNVLIEAMACAVPCVTTDVGESAAVVADPARVVPVGDPESLADAMIDVLRLNTQERRALGMRDRSRVLASYSLDGIAARYLDLYEEIRGASA